MRKCLFCVTGLYVGPWLVGSVFKASSERRVQSGISRRDVLLLLAPGSLVLSVLQKRD